MHKKNNIQKHFLYFSLFLFFLVIVVSCVPQTPSPSEEFPPTPCPEETLIVPTPFDHSISNKYIIVLVDKSGSYRRYDPLHDYAAESLVLINDVLSKTLSPGDRILVDWIANDKDRDRNKVIFEGEVEEIIDEPLTYDPTPTSPELIPTLAVYGSDIQKDKIREQNEEIEKQNRLRSRGYYCEVYKWNQDAPLINAEEDKEWKRRYENALNGLLPSLNNTINNAITEKNAQETHLYEGLSVASRKFHEPLIQRSYEKYILIIFSDMIDSHRGKDYYLNFDIDLSTVDVLIANYLCLQEYEKCLNQSMLIQDQFLNVYNSNSAAIKFPIETNREILINFIEKGY
ncbi:MAG: hypothetical protein AABZ00_02020 [Chloroflexota bacterium]